ncbi:3'-5' exoribonuclease, partial [Escherichia coli]
LLGRSSAASDGYKSQRHNALHDARYQAKYVSAIWQKLLPSQADF